MRVDPPAGPIHTRPYGPARRSLIAHYPGPLTDDQADHVRALVTARLPGWDVLIADNRWTFTNLDHQPEPEDRRTNP